MCLQDPCRPSSGSGRSRRPTLWSRRTWDVRDDDGERPNLQNDVQSGASDPLAISLESFELQFRDFANAIRQGKKPLVSGEEGFDLFAIVQGVYDSCRSGKLVPIERLT